MFTRFIAVASLLFMSQLTHAAPADCLDQANKIAEFHFGMILDTVPNASSVNGLEKITNGTESSTWDEGRAEFPGIAINMYQTTGNYYISAGVYPSYKVTMDLSLTEECTVESMKVLEEKI